MLPLTLSQIKDFIKERLAKKSVILGYDVECLGEKSVVIGQDSYAGGGEAIVIGNNSQALGDKSIAIGSGSIATNGAIAIGSGANASNPGQILISTKGNGGTWTEISFENGNIVFSCCLSNGTILRRTYSMISDF